VSVLSAMGPRPASPAAVTVELALAPDALPPRVAAAAMEEATRIWAAYGVDVRFSGPPPQPRRTVWLDVHVAAGDAPSKYTATLGSIAFAAGHPGSRILLYPSAACDLLTMLTSGTNRQWPRLRRETTLGRVLGRALAHEVGHYLLRSEVHSREGLMRANQPIGDLAASGADALFVLTPEEQARLHRTIPALFGHAPS